MRFIGTHEKGRFHWWVHINKCIFRWECFFDQSSVVGRKTARRRFLPRSAIFGKFRDFSHFSKKTEKNAFFHENLVKF